MSIIYIYVYVYQCPTQLDKEIYEKWRKKAHSVKTREKENGKRKDDKLKKL